MATDEDRFRVVEELQRQARGKPMRPIKIDGEMRYVFSIPTARKDLCRRCGHPQKSHHADLLSWGILKWCAGTVGEGRCPCADYQEPEAPRDEENP